jgi:hypothetical protein
VEGKWSGLFTWHNQGVLSLLLSKVHHQVVAFTSRNAFSDEKEFHFEAEGSPALVEANLAERFQSFGANLALEFILGARDCQMKHLLLARASDSFFRIDWEYVLEYFAKPDPNLSWVLKGDEWTFLQYCPCEVSGAVRQGFSDTLLLARERMPALMDIVGSHAEMPADQRAGLLSEMQRRASLSFDDALSEMMSN